MHDNLRWHALVTVRCEGKPSCNITSNVGDTFSEDPCPLVDESTEIFYVCKPAPGIVMYGSNYMPRLTASYWESYLNLVYSITMHYMHYILHTQCLPLPIGILPVDPCIPCNSPPKMPANMVSDDKGSVKYGTVIT